MALFKQFHKTGISFLPLLFIFGNKINFAVSKKGAKTYQNQGVRYDIQPLNFPSEFRKGFSQTIDENWAFTLKYSSWRCIYYLLCALRVQTVYGLLSNCGKSILTKAYQ